jgi:hypothetical protein
MEPKCDQNRCIPPLQSKYNPYLRLFKIWLDSYKTVAGPDFVKTVLLENLTLLVGGINLNTTGTITFGMLKVERKLLYSKLIT